MYHMMSTINHPLLQGEGWGEDGSAPGFAKPIPAFVLPLKGRKLSALIKTAAKRMSYCITNAEINRDERNNQS
jgi:hypothetical protein